jgi:prevent-host-death family protein
MSQRTSLNLSVDLQAGVVPISKAASSLAALIKRANASGQPIIMTQKGYPTGVLLPVPLFSALKALADGVDGAEITSLPELIDAIDDAPEQGPALKGADVGAPKGRRPAARRRKRVDVEPAEVGS